MKWIMLILVLAEFACAMYYKRRAKIIEKGLTSLAKLAFTLKTKEDCEKLAAIMVNSMKQNGNKRTNNTNI